MKSRNFAVPHFILMANYGTGDNFRNEINLASHVVLMTVFFLNLLIKSEVNFKIKMVISISATRKKEEKEKSARKSIFI